MNTERVRQGFTSNHIKQILLSGVCALALGLTTTAGSSPAAAKSKTKEAGKDKEHASNLPFGDIPKGPLEIFVSINQQKLHFYSGGVHIIDEPVATGMPGHLSPLGVFSVIERDRYHHSNIYDNAPMPYMERITWSGVALHQGVGLGHQASHGCIRMPEDFAARLWRLPTMGMRVIIARPELRPTEFADPHLFVHKAPAPVAAMKPAVQTAQTIDPATKTDAVDPPPSTPAAASPAPTAEAAPASTQQPSPAPKPDAVATTVAGPVPPATAAQTAQPNSTAPSLADIVKTAENDATKPSEQPTPAGAESANTNTAAATTPEATPAKPADEAAVQAAAPATAQPAPTTPAPANTAETSTPGAAAPSTTPVPGETATVTPAAGITAPISLDDVPLPLAKPAQIARDGGGGGPIAIFVSRKNGRIYVRQDFIPVFDAPVKIDHSDQPIGTHVFTAISYLPDHSTFRWTVTTLPGEPPRAEEQWKYVKDADGKRKRVRVEEHVASAEPAAAPATPQEALARIDIPQDVIDQIQQLIVPGSSLVVSDEGLGPETDARGTDFIVLQR